MKKILLLAVILMSAALVLTVMSCSDKNRKEVKGEVLSVSGHKENVVDLEVKKLYPEPKLYKHQVFIDVITDFSELKDINEVDPSLLGFELKYNNGVVSVNKDTTLSDAEPFVFKFDESFIEKYENEELSGYTIGVAPVWNKYSDDPLGYQLLLDFEDGTLSYINMESFELRDSYDTPYINGISLNSSLGDIMRILGKPTEISPVFEQNEMECIHYMWDGYDNLDFISVGFFIVYDEIARQYNLKLFKFSIMF